MRIFVAAAFAVLMAGSLAEAADPDPLVKQAQTFLAALGYKVGAADGVAGKRTEAAIAEAMAAYGQPYDGAISENEVALLSRVAPARIEAEFGVAVSELSYLDAADINGDGRLDFVVAAMGDPFAQLGVRCCNLTTAQMKQITPPAPVLIYSTPGGYATTPFPEEAKGNRTQAGKFLLTANGIYFVVAKNGEMGLPSQNHGEVSVVVRIDASAPEITITNVVRYDGPGVTASVDAADINGDGQPEIMLNNYGPFGPMTRGGISTLKTFTAAGTLEQYKWFVPLETDKPHNYLRFDDIDGNGALDILAAVEVLKTEDGATLRSKRPGSYVLLNPFEREAKHADRIYLEPPHFGNDHAGFSLMPVKAGGRTFIFESAMQFLGNEGGKFKYDNLDVFEFDAAAGTMTLVSDEVLPEKPPTRGEAGGFYLMRADIDFDGVDEVYRLNYARRPQYYDWDGKAFALKDFPAKDYFKPEYVGTMFLLPDPELKCTRMVTMPQNLGNGGSTSAELRITACIPVAS